MKRVRKSLAIVAIMAVTACTSGGGSTSAPSAAASSAASAAPSAASESTLDRVRREGIVRVGFGNEPPFAYTDGEKLTGESPEILRAFMSTIGVNTLEGVLGEFAGLIPGLQANRFDVIAAGMYVRPARCAEVDFSIPHFALGFDLIVKKGNPKGLTSFKAIADNADAKFGTVTGSAGAEYTKYNGIPDERVTLYPDNTATLAALQAGRIDVMSIDVLAGVDLLKKANDPNLEQIHPTEPALDENGKPAIGYGAMAFRKDDDDLREAYNAWLATAKESGELARITEPFGFKPEDIAPVEVDLEALCTE